MMSARLVWMNRHDGVGFECHSQEGLVPPDKWAIVCPTTERGGRARIEVLLALAADGRADVDGAALRVSHSEIEALDQAALAGLGLPEVCPLVLAVKCDGLPSDRTFALRPRWWIGVSRPAQSPSRLGAILTVGQRQYVLGAPLFSWIEAIERFNAMVFDAPQARLAALADVMEALSPSIRLDDFLSGIRIFPAARFTVIPFANRQQEADFEVVPCSRPRSSTVETDAAEAEEEVEAALLPKQLRRQFAEAFRQLPDVHPVYPLGDGRYVAVAPSLQTALKRVKGIQGLGAAERRDFIRNPRVFIRQALDDAVSPDELEGLFAEVPEYSDRVREIGVWQPRVLPFLTRPGQEWLPEDGFGLRVDDRAIIIGADEVLPLIAAVEEAIRRGEPTVPVGSELLPATVETLEYLRSFAAATHPPTDTPKGPVAPASGQMVLKISDNLEQLDYEGAPRLSRAVDGGAPSSLRTSLLSHQEVGLRWLQARWASGRRGALLADDMGLGKTLQVIVFQAWVQAMAKRQEPRRMLVVAPTGLLRNWMDEIQLHLKDPWLGEIQQAHGAELKAMRLAVASRGNELSGGAPVLDLERLKSADVVFTTYETLRDYQHSFGAIPWSVLVLDEAQKIKNPAALMTDAVKAMNADFVVALTGTPVENGMADLWSIVDRVEPGHLSSLKAFLALVEPGGTPASEALIQVRRQLMDGDAALMLRRMKADHLQGLPEMHFHIERQDMPAGQAQAYRAAVLRARTAGCDKGQMLKALQDLRAISLHPDPESEMVDDAFWSASARLAHAIRVLDRVRDAGEKALLFLESKGVQQQLLSRLQRRYGLSEPPLLINGDVAGDWRKRRVDTFQQRKGFDVMVLSPRAGGVGITLTAANHVIHVSRWWNPAVEDQCTDRVYRIGQKRAVHVHLPLAVHPQYAEASFDVKLHALLERKRQLSRTVLTPGVLGATDIQELYSGTVAAH